MSIPRHLHFVPQMLLRRFVDRDGHLHVFDKRFLERGVICTGPANVFVQRDIYNQRGEDGSWDVSVEQMLGRLESVANNVVEKIVTAARQRKIPNLTKEEKKVWDEFVYIQWKRVPDVHNKTMSEKEFEERIDIGVNDYEATIRLLTSEERERFNDPSVRSRIQKAARVGAVAAPGGEAVEVLGAKGLLIALVAIPNKSFIIGSHPVVKLNHPGRSYLGDPSVELWLPIAHDVAVTPCFARETERLVEVEKHDDIRYINMAIYSQSTTIAGRSSALISSLARIP